MALSAGTRIGPYEVVGTLGAGGMGEVYRARDTRLKRDVALKILPDAFAADPERLARFQREAEVLASLNHPHIAAIYGLEDSGDTHALVMELVEGEDLSQRIARGPIPLDEALPIAKQIADALEAAHERGVIHRDLKPANIKITPGGVVKVLDFGLAKLAAGSGQPAAGSPHLSQSPTITSPAMMTGVGVLLGTAAYMSPEQAKGREADKRSDIWAFGCVLYEMLTGKRAFEGDDITETLAAVVRAEPDWPRLPATTPPAIRVLLQRCLVKQPGRRLRDIGDARFDLEADPTASSPPPARSSRRVWTMGAIAAALGIVVGAGATWQFARPVTSAPSPSAFIIETPQDHPLTTGPNETSLAIAPDGSFVVYTSGSSFGQAFSQRTLMIRRLDALDAVPLFPRTTNIQPSSPFVSADGRWVGFVTGTSIMKVPATGGAPVPVCECNPTTRGGAAWLADDTIIYNQTGGHGLRSVSANGEGDRPLTTVDGDHGELDHIGPAAVPGSRFIVFSAFAQPVGRSSIQVLNLDTGARRQLVNGGQFVRYVNPGYLAYLDAFSNVRAIGFDAARGETRGDPIPLDELPVDGSGVNAGFDLSQTGTLVYLPGGQATADRVLAWVSRNGDEQALNLPAHGYLLPRFSPNGAFVALDVREPQSSDLWLLDVKRDTLSKLTSGGTRNSYPVWTPDGRELLYVSNEKGPENIYRRGADGSGAPRVLTDHKNPLLPYAISPDGTMVVLRELVAGGVDLALLRLGRTPGVEPLVHRGANADLSPDGRWIVYESDQSGQSEIYVQPFPDVSHGRWQVSNAGGRTPLWARNGREILYVDGENNLMRVEVTPGTAFSVSRPSRFFTGSYSSRGWFRGQGGRVFDLAPDGTRFLVVKDRPGVDSRRPTDIRVILNWQETLKRLVPVADGK